MKKWLILSIIFLITFLSACAPKTTPAPSPSVAKPATSTPAAPPISNISTLTSQDAAWDKVIAAAKKEGKLTIYSFTWIGDAGITISGAFKQKYGISIEIVTGRGAEFVERLKTEKRIGQRVADLAEGSSLHVGNMKIEGLLTSVADELPSLKEKGVWLVDPTALDRQEKKNLVLRLLAYSPFINTNLIKSPETPRTWKDLLDPKWKGKMTLTEPNVSAGPYETIVVLMENKIWDEDYIRALYKQGLRFPASTPDEFTLLARGESSIAIRGTDASASRFVTEGAPIQAIAMKEGEVVSTGSIGAIAGSPSPNAAKALLNWLYSKEGLTVAGKALGNKMVRNDVPDTRPKGIQTDSDKPLVVSLDNLDTATQLFRQKWFDKVVGR